MAGGVGTVPRPANGVLYNPWVSLGPQPPCKSLVRSLTLTRPASSRSGDCSLAHSTLRAAPPAINLNQRHCMAPQFKGNPPKRKSSPPKSLHVLQPHAAGIDIG